MTYTGQLPSLSKLRKLAEWDGPFPMKSYRIVIGAERYGFDTSVIQFLQLFPHDEVFRSRNDFLQRCQNLETIIRSEQDMPRELLRSPQD
jgi:hypothetical protein